VRTAAKQCLAELSAMGHSHVAILEGARPLPPIMDFIAATRSRKFVVTQLQSAAQGFDPIQTLRELMATGSRPTVIVGFLGEALRMKEAARLLKVKVPEELSIVAIRDRSMIVSAEASMLSTIHIDPGPMGALAAETLKAWLTRDEALTSDKLIDIGSWVARETTGPIC
jgi:DNA-binding LacI/PurR family transcriptional regulator